MLARPVRSSVAALVAAIVVAPTASQAATAPERAPYVIRMSVDEDPIVPHLAQTLGYLKEENVRIVPVKVEDFSKEDYLLQAPLIKGQIDVAYHWFNHAVFGARHDLPIKAIMVINDAPGMTVMVANRVKGEIRSAADFKGRRVAEGAGYGTKSVITHALTSKAGLPLHSFTPVMEEASGRQEAVLAGIDKGTVDVMTFQEPITSALLATRKVSVLYDLNSKEGTEKALGATYPAQSILASPAYLEKHSVAVQHLINAFVKTMRFINAHSVDEIVERLPASYFDGKDRAAELAEMRATKSTFAKGDYAFSPASVRVVVDSIRNFDFDGSEEGQWRATGDNAKLVEDRLYDNRFVERAMGAIR